MQPRKLGLIFSILILISIKCFGLAPADIYKSAEKSILYLQIENHDGSISGGSAFVAINSKVAITANHVIKNAKNIKATTSRGDTFPITILQGKMEAFDVAAIALPKALIPLKIKDELPVIGEKALVIGSPQGLEFSISDGIVSQIRIIKNVAQIQFTCPASPGNSGGPLINSSGECIGVVSWQMVNGQNLNFAVPITYAKMIPLDNPVTFQEQTTPFQRDASKKAFEKQNKEPETSTQKAFDVVTEIKGGKGFLSPERWRLLRKGMNKKQVAVILGSPRYEDENYWKYGIYVQVNFFDGKLTSWRQPTPSEFLFGIK